MKKLFALAVLPLLLFTASFAVTGCGHPQPPPYYGPPPPPLPAIARQGYGDGVRAARRDISQGLPPHVARHPRFRVPPFPPGEPAHAYRVNFRRGYQSVYTGR